MDNTRPEDDAILDTADAIDALLDNAISARSLAVKHYKQAEKNVSLFKHSVMYSKLNHLPKNKLTMFQQMNKLREELAHTKSKFARNNKILNAENRQLRAGKKAAESRLESTVSKMHSLEETIKNLEAENKKMKESLQEAETIESREQAKYEEMTLNLKYEYQKKDREAKARCQLLMDRVEALELEVDNYRGKVATSRLDLLEMEFGLKSYSSQKEDHHHDHW